MGQYVSVVAVSEIKALGAGTFVMVEEVFRGGDMISPCIGIEQYDVSVARPGVVKPARVKA
jgi:hypothetical protein